jgi:GNAT superfamily N-acetyltransferase
MGALSGPEPIGSQHNIAGFSCGQQSLDEWLKQRALRSEGRSARTYVVAEDGNVIAYYCFAAGAVRHGEAPKQLQRNMPDPLPVILLGRLAVDAGQHGRGIGKGLLRDALKRALEVSRHIGARAVLVHAIDDAAARFYERAGFTRFTTEPRTLFITIEAIAADL